MTITNEPLEWSSDDEVALRNFLVTQTGRRFLPKLAESSPVNLPGGNTNDILIRSGEVRGFGEALRTMLSLAFRPAKPELEVESQTNYPALENDAAWTDGEKLNA